jgi:hypothetical protein
MKRLIRKQECTRPLVVLLLFLLFPPVWAFGTYSAPAVSPAISLPADLFGGPAALLPPWLFPGVMLSGWGNLFRTRLSIAIVVITAISSGIIMIGSFGGWFGHHSGEPLIWDEGHLVKISGRPAYAVYVNIQNQGSASLKLRLNPGASPEETGLILSAQRYSDTGNHWVDYPVDKLLSERSKSMFPVEIRPGGTMLIEMVFLQPDSAEEVNSKDYNASGRYAISIVDPVHLHIYHHEIEVPDFSNSPA